MVGYHQIAELVVARPTVFGKNTKMKQIQEECKANGSITWKTSEFSEMLEARIVYGEAAQSASMRFNEIERALGNYGISAKELEQFSNNVADDYVLKAGIEYERLGNSTTRRSYDLAFEISKGNPEQVAKVLGIDSKQVRKQVKELTTAYALNKHGFNELASKLPGSKYIDIISTAKSNIIELNSGNNLQGNLIEYLEAELVRRKLFEEVNANSYNAELSKQFSQVYNQLEEMKETLRKQPNFEEWLRSKYDAAYYEKNPPVLTTDISVVYQRALTGKLVGSDYAILKHHISQNIGMQEKMNRSIGIRW